MHDVLPIVAPPCHVLSYGSSIIMLHTVNLHLPQQSTVLLYIVTDTINYQLHG